MAEDDGQLHFEFEGMEVEEFKYKLGGKAIAENVERIEVDDEVWFLVRGRCVGVNHERRGQEGTFTREQKITVIGARRVDKDTEIAEALIDEATQYLQDIADEHPDKPKDEGEGGDGVHG